MHWSLANGLYSRIIAQATAIIAFIPIGVLSSKFGRKKMILVGVALLTISFASASFLTAQTGWIIYIILGLTGIAWATINVNSFPMVVELATGNDVGKYTGYYYTFSMAAQIMTPVLSGAFMHYLDAAHYSLCSILRFCFYYYVIC